MRTNRLWILYSGLYLDFYLGLYSGFYLGFLFCFRMLFAKLIRSGSLKQIQAILGCAYLDGRSAEISRTAMVWLQRFKKGSKEGSRKEFRVRIQSENSVWESRAILILFAFRKSIWINLNQFERLNTVELKVRCLRHSSIEWKSCWPAGVNLRVSWWSSSPRYQLGTKLFLQLFGTTNNGSLNMILPTWYC